MVGRWRKYPFGMAHVHRGYMLHVSFRKCMGVECLMKIIFSSFLLFFFYLPLHPILIVSKINIKLQDRMSVKCWNTKYINCLFILWANSMQMTLFQQHGLASWNIFFRISYAQNPCEIHSFPLSPLEYVKVGGCTGPHIPFLLKEM